MQHNAQAQHAVLRACRLQPTEFEVWDTMLTDIGLDATDVHESTEDPIGVGNAAAAALIAARSNDGALPCCLLWSVLANDCTAFAFDTATRHTPRPST